MMRSFLMILPLLLKPTHQAEVAASDAFVVAVDAEVAADCVTLPHSFLTFSLQRHWWPPRFWRTLQRRHF
ncbi:hypothetical protein OHD47_28265 [Escherichia coli]|nr:hypothetical protein [Escherichia coli]MCW7363617.1 hypothetical protein [Escherichia coli]